jgi:hypothetical protein
MRKLDNRGRCLASLFILKGEGNSIHYFSFNIMTPAMVVFVGRGCRIQSGQLPRLREDIQRNVPDERFILNGR